MPPRRLTRHVVILVRPTRLVLAELQPTKTQTNRNEAADSEQRCYRRLRYGVNIINPELADNRECRLNRLCRLR